MRPLNKLDAGADRVQDMARKLGRDLAAGENPHVFARRFRAMVTACSACEFPAHCDMLRARNRSLAEAPRYCVNRARFGHP